MSRKITQNTAITNDQVDTTNDQVPIVDVSDNTDSASGTTKKITPAELAKTVNNVNPGAKLFLYYNFY